MYTAIRKRLFHLIHPLRIRRGDGAFPNAIPERRSASGFMGPSRPGWPFRYRGEQRRGVTEFVLPVRFFQE